MLTRIRECVSAYVEDCPSDEGELIRALERADPDAAGGTSKAHVLATHSAPASSCTFPIEDRDDVIGALRAQLQAHADAAYHGTCTVAITAVHVLADATCIDTYVRGAFARRRTHVERVLWRPMQTIHEIRELTAAADVTLHPTLTLPRDAAEAIVAQYAALVERPPSDSSLFLGAADARERSLPLYVVRLRTTSVPRQLDGTALCASGARRGAPAQP